MTPEEMMGKGKEVATESIYWEMQEARKKNKKGSARGE